MKNKLRYFIIFHEDKAGTLYLLRLPIVKYDFLLRIVRSPYTGELVDAFDLLPIDKKAYSWGIKGEAWLD